MVTRTTGISAGRNVNIILRSASTSSRFFSVIMQSHAVMGRTVVSELLHSSDCRSNDIEHVNIMNSS